MRNHVLISLFQDDVFQTNQLYLNAQQSQLIRSSASNSTHSTSNTEDSYSFNNFHDYLGSSYSIIYLVILSITCIEILIGNSLLIYTVFSNKLFGNKLTTNHVVMSLAISDLLIGLLIMPYYIFAVRLFSLANKKCWHYEVWSNLDSSLTTASIYSLCLVTLDRYLAITRPLAYTRKISNRKVKWCIWIIWVISILTTFLSSIIMWILNFIIEDDDQRAINRRQIEQNVYFHIVLAILTFYIPFVLILYFNVATYVTIKRRLTDKKLKINKVENGSRSSQRVLLTDDGKQSESSNSNNTTITSQQQLNSSNSQSNDSSNSSKLCLNCFTNSNYVSVISGNQIDFNNNAGQPLRNSFKKKLTNRRCSLCSCQISRNLKKESIAPFNSSYHFSFTKQNFNSLANTFTWKTFHRTFILEKLQQKHKEGLKKNTVFKEYKLIKLLLTINCCFTVCWGPIYVYQELVRFNFVTVDNHLLNYFLFLGWLNSAIDPIIYLHLSKKMRKEIKQKLFCLK